MEKEKIVGEGIVLFTSLEDEQRSSVGIGFKKAEAERLVVELSKTWPSSDASSRVKELDTEKFTLAKAMFDGDDVYRINFSWPKNRSPQFYTRLRKKGEESPPSTRDPASVFGLGTKVKFVCEPFLLKKTGKPYLKLIGLAKTGEVDRDLFDSIEEEDCGDMF